MLERFVTKALIVLACCMLLALPVSTALAQEGVWEGTKKAVQKGAEGVKKGAETTVDKTEDVGEAVGKGIKKGAETAVDKTEDAGEAVGKGVKEVFTDDDSATEAQRSKPGTTSSGMESTAPTTSGTESTAPTTSQRETETMNRQLPKTAGDKPLFVLIGALSLLGAVALKLARRLPNSR